MVKDRADFKSGIRTVFWDGGMIPLRFINDLLEKQGEPLYQAAKE